ncbi:hypothetical protein JS531_05825 [Bifidobacterium sp. CP2]|uniref:hypothetical protein n=1 Tax=Bifidobacterium sp. CP2 TaxID=2809025 RepID=UPI001BDD5514|nr:hypothetical protein [Bifidobacterium sp. CP2]MBT1181490.1 hypothetical protein [Bifidobacterium sp. CP2]
MGYESLSTIIVLVIVIIGIVVWLPIRTANSMRHVEEHRTDRYSTSLHLVDEHSGTRFSDDRTYVKGVSMQPKQRRATTLTPARIAEVRRLRHEATRRRRIIVLTLLLATALVLGLAFALHYSPLFALIPAVLAAVVVVLGAHAAKQARAWEHKVALMRSRERKAKVRAAKRQAHMVEVHTARMKAAVDAAAAPAGSVPETKDDAVRRGNADLIAKAVNDDAGDVPVNDDAPTDRMERREIRRVLRQAQEEKRRALAERAAREEAGTPEASAEAASVSVSVESGAVAEDVKAVDEPAAQADGDAKAVEESVSDATAELVEVRPAKALDAFDMAAMSPELISFTLGEARNGVEQEDGTPESLEIRSTRQVSKATPVSREEQDRLADEAKVETEPAVRPAADGTPSGRPADDVASAASQGDADAASAEAASADASDAAPAVTDVAAFHTAEERARVAAPAATSDSLGNDLQAVLARRNG